MKMNIRMPIKQDPSFLPIQLVQKSRYSALNSASSGGRWSSDRWWCLICFFQLVLSVVHIMSRMLLSLGWLQHRILCFINGSSTSWDRGGWLYRGCRRYWRATTFLIVAVGHMLRCLCCTTRGSRHWKMIASRRLIFGKIRSCCFIRVGKLCIPLPLKCAGSSIIVPFFLNLAI